MKIESYFENQQDVVISNLEKAQREVTILMAWLNFDIYGDTFAALLKRKVCLKILLDNNQSNFKYSEKIQKLKKAGAKILFYQYSGIMHIKDAVIDDRILLTGSFNWTKNANLRNKEKLEVQEAENLYDKAQLVEEIRQFYRNCLVSTQVFNILKNTTVCDSCGSSKVLLAIPTETDYNNTIFHFLECCQCGTKEIAQISFPIYVWEMKNEIISQRNENLQICHNACERKAIKKIYKTKLEIFYIDLFQNFKDNDMPDVHGIAEVAYRDTKYDDGSAYYKVIWKYPGIENIILGEYEIGTVF